MSRRSSPWVWLPPNGEWRGGYERLTAHAEYLVTPSKTQPGRWVLHEKHFREDPPEFFVSALFDRAIDAMVRGDQVERVYEDGSHTPVSTWDRLQGRQPISKDAAAGIPGLGKKR